MAQQFDAFGNPIDDRFSLDFATPPAALAQQAAAPTYAQNPYQWNADNAFQSWDLNPLAGQLYGGQDGARDYLSSTRNDYLQPLMSKYRQRVGAGNSNDDDYGLFNDADFQNFAKTGQTSKGYAADPAPPRNPAVSTAQTVAQQWNSQPSVQQNAERNAALYGQLQARANQSLNVDRNDPAIRAQADAYAANEERARRNYVSDAAERGGPLGNIEGERLIASERAGQRTGTFESMLVGQEMTARRQEIAQALTEMGSMLSEDQRNALQMQLSQIDAALREQGYGIQQQGLGLDRYKADLQNTQFNDRLGLDAEDLAAKYDLLRRGY